MPTVRLSFTPAATHVRTARLVAVAVARRAGVSAELYDEIRLAIGEACSRAVALHRQHGLHDLVEVVLSDGASFTIRVTDRAPIDAALSPPSGDSDPVALMEEAATDDPPGWRDETPPAAGEQGAPDHAVDEAEEAVAVGMRLALLASLVEQITVRPAEHGSGTEVVMSWPVQPPSGNGRP